MTSTIEHFDLEVASLVTVITRRVNSTHELSSWIAREHCTDGQPDS